MISLRAKKETAPPPRSEEREALAAAIDRRDSLAREVDATSKALAELRAVSGDVRAAVKIAEEAIEAAKVNGAAYLAAVAGGTAGEAPQSVRDARAAHQAAVDDLETHQLAVTGLEARLEANERGLGYAKDRVKDAVRKVVAADPAFRTMFADYEDLRALVLRRAEVLHSLSKFTPRELDNWDAIPPYVAKLGLPDEAVPMHNAIAALEKDADAPLPTSA